MLQAGKSPPYFSQDPCSQPSGKYFSCHSLPVLHHLFPHSLDPSLLLRQLLLELFLTSAASSFLRVTFPLCLCSSGLGGTQIHTRDMEHTFLICCWMDLLVFLSKPTSGYLLLQNRPGLLHFRYTPLTFSPIGRLLGGYSHKQLSLRVLQLCLVSD